MCRRRRHTSSKKETATCDLTLASWNTQYERERERESEGTEKPITGSEAWEGPGQGTGFVHRLAQVNSSLSILETARHYEAVISLSICLSCQGPNVRYALRRS